MGRFRIGVALIGILSLVSCQQRLPNERDRAEKIKIVTTTGMIHDAVKNIVGDHGEVIALMGPKGTPQGTYIGMVSANVKTIADALK